MKRCGDQRKNPLIATFSCGLVQTSNTKARPQDSQFPGSAEGALPRPSAPSFIKLAGYKGQRLRRRRD